MFDRSAHKPVCNTGERARRDELHGCQDFALRSRRGHALIEIPLDENTLCIFERPKLDRNADSDA